MINVINAAVKLGYMNVPNGTLIDIDDIKKDLTILKDYEKIFSRIIHFNYYNCIGHYEPQQLQ